MSVAMFSLIGKVIVRAAVFQNVGVGYAAVGHGGEGLYQKLAVLQISYLTLIQLGPGNFFIWHEKSWNCSRK